MKISSNSANLWILICVITAGFIGLTQTKTVRKAHKRKAIRRQNVTIFGQPELTKPNICTTPECHTVAKRIKEAINTSVNPCDDFFLFSCGQWIKKHQIPKSYNDYSTFTRLSKEIEAKLRNLLENRSSLEALPENEALRKAKDFYHSCMNTELIEKQGAEPLKQYIRSIGSWSVCDDGSWDKKNWDVYKHLKMLQNSYYPASPFFSVEVTNDHLNSSKHLIKVKFVFDILIF